MLSIWSEVELQDLEQFSQKAGALVLDKAQISVECIVYQLKNPLIPIFGALFPISGNRKRRPVFPGMVRNGNSRSPLTGDLLRPTTKYVDAETHLQISNT